MQASSYQLIHFFQPFKANQERLIIQSKKKKRQGE